MLCILIIFILSFLYRFFKIILVHLYLEFSSFKFMKYNYVYLDCINFVLDRNKYNTLNSKVI